LKIQCQFTTCLMNGLPAGIDFSPEYAYTKRLTVNVICGV
jgi:hypothetical protein